MMREYSINCTLEASAVIGGEFIDESPEAIGEAIKEMLENDLIELHNIRVKTLKFSPGEVIVTDN